MTAMDKDQPPFKKNDDRENKFERDPLTAKIIEACYQVHTELGPGFVERIYMNALILALEKRGLEFETEKEYVVKYEEKPVGKFRVDILVAHSVIVELKAV